jgi:hypothetical protein
MKEIKHMLFGPKTTSVEEEARRAAQKAAVKRESDLKNPATGHGISDYEESEAYNEADVDERIDLYYELKGRGVDPWPDREEDEEEEQPRGFWSKLFG